MYLSMAFVDTKCRTAELQRDPGTIVNYTLGLSPLTAGNSQKYVDQSTYPRETRVNHAVLVSCSWLPWRQFFMDTVFRRPSHTRRWVRLRLSSSSWSNASRSPISHHQQVAKWPIIIRSKCARMPVSEVTNSIVVNLAKRKRHAVDMKCHKSLLVMSCLESWTTSVSGWMNKWV